MPLKTVRRGLILGGALSALALAGTASAATLHGVVVRHNSRAHNFVVALRGGRLASVHSHRIPNLGRVVVVSARELRNGTFAARHVRTRNGVRTRVVLRGVVTSVNRHRGAFTISANRASLLVRAHQRSLPARGEDVQVTAQLDDQGNLDDQGVDDCQGDEQGDTCSSSTTGSGDDDCQGDEQGDTCSSSTTGLGDDDCQGDEQGDTCSTSTTGSDSQGDDDTQGDDNSQDLSSFSSSGSGSSSGGGNSQT